MEKICGVYLIVSPTGKRYVGSSIDIAKRWMGYRSLRCKAQVALYKSFLKHGVKTHTFTVLKECLFVELFRYERIFGDQYKTLGSLNCVLPGYDDVPVVRSIETKKRMSAGSIRRFERPEEREKNRQRILERFKNPEYRKNQSEKTKAYSTKPETIERFTNRMKACHSTPEAKAANKAKAIKYFSSPEIRNAVRKRVKEYLSNPENCYQSKKVVNTETGEIFLTIKKAAKAIGMSQANLWRQLHGKCRPSTPLNLFITAEAEAAA